MPNIPIPTEADINTRRAFESIENRLRALEKKPSGGEDLIGLDDRLRSIEDKSDPEDTEINGDLWVANDITAHGEIDMPHLYEGLIEVRLVLLPLNVHLMCMARLL
jgi:hypothetical protein